MLGESSLPDLSHGLSFQKNKNKQAKKLPDDFTRSSFFTILFFNFVKKHYYFFKCLSTYDAKRLVSVFVVVVFLTAFERFKTLWANFFNHRCFRTATNWLFLCQVQQLATKQTPRGHPWVNYICASVNSYERPTSLNHSYHLHESRWADTPCTERPTTNQSIELPWFNLRYRLPVQRRADELSIDLFLLCFL